MGFKSNGINDFDIEALKREQEEKKRLAKLEEERAAARASQQCHFLSAGRNHGRPLWALFQIYYSGSCTAGCQRWSEAGAAKNFVCDV